MSDDMLAIRKAGARPGWSLEEVPIPAPGTGEVLVAVDAASVCGTDLHIVDWNPWAAQRVKPPLTLGHELAGTVVEVGPGVRAVAVEAVVWRNDPALLGSDIACLQEPLASRRTARSRRRDRRRLSGRPRTCAPCRCGSERSNRR